MKKKQIILGTALALASCGAALGGAQSAVADTPPKSTISNLQSPGGGGALEAAQIDWDGIYVYDITGELFDNAADGVGPYLHLYPHYADGYSTQNTGIAGQHNTMGYGSDTEISGGFTAPDSSHGAITYVNVWVCNGGDIAGNGTKNGGCYGRTYYNQQVTPGKGSVSLGNTGTGNQPYVSKR